MSQLGRKMRINRSTDGGTSYNPLAGGRTDTLKINNEPVDVTNKGSGSWRELHPEVPISSVDLTFEGVVKDTVLVQLALNPTAGLQDLQLVIEGVGTITGQYMISGYEEGGQHNGEQTFTANFMSSGAQVWNDAP